MFYKKEDSGSIRCELCPHRCIIAENSCGRCGVRKVYGNELYALNYGLCAAAASDPVEKKPLYHFYPGRMILSLGTFGCNFKCLFCQNWSLARNSIQPNSGMLFKRPEDILKMLEKEHPAPVGIAYTYNEPAVWFEYVLDTAKYLKDYGYKNVLVTNGFISREALKALIPYIDAMNVDVKAFNNDFYRDYCSGNIHAVKETVEYCFRRCHLEVTYLVIPTLNDSMEEVGSFIDWLASLDPRIPVHFSRYFPSCELNLPPTPVDTLTAVREKALEKLQYVYIGNLGGGNPYANTYCPFCNNRIIIREIYNAVADGIDSKNRCFKCQNEIFIVNGL